MAWRGVSCRVCLPVVVGGQCGQQLLTLGLATTQPHHLVAKIQGFPVVGIGRDYWSAIEQTVNETMVASGTIDPIDTDLFRITDDPGEAVSFLLSRLAHPDTPPRPDAPD